MLAVPLAPRASVFSLAPLADPSPLTAKNVASLLAYRTLGMYVRKALKESRQGTCQQPISLMGAPLLAEQGRINQFNLDQQHRQGDAVGVGQLVRGRSSTLGVEAGQPHGSYN